MKIYILLILSFFTLVSNGQATIIGHIFAEVVESVSAKSQIITDFTINNDCNNINMGSVTINSNNKCSVIVNQTNFSQPFNISPSTHIINGSKTVEIIGTSNIASNTLSEDYVGSYSMTFLYD